MASKLQACLRSNGTLQWRLTPPSLTPRVLTVTTSLWAIRVIGMVDPLPLLLLVQFQGGIHSLAFLFFNLLFIKLVSIQHILILLLLPQILPDSTSVPASCPFPLFLLLPGQQKGAVRCHGVCPHTPGQSPGLGPLSNTKQTHSFCFLVCFVSLFGCWDLMFLMISLVVPMLLVQRTGWVILCPSTVCCTHFSAQTLCASIYMKRVNWNSYTE